MICQKCQTFYVRDPCPNCGKDNSKRVDEPEESSVLNEEGVKPSKVRQRETSSGSQVLVQKTDDDEQLVKPSQRLRMEREQDKDRPSFERIEQQEKDDEQLVKPSERLKQDQDEEDIPSFKRFDKAEGETRSSMPSQPTRISKKDRDEDDIPSFQRYQKEEKVDVTNISKLNKPEHQEKLENDKEYRNQVKETLEEVMGLLEKLIEDD